MNQRFEWLISNGEVCNATCSLYGHIVSLTGKLPLPKEASHGSYRNLSAGRLRYHPAAGVSANARQGEMWDLLQGDRELERSARIHKQENRELQSALRAEREHVSQLQRQVQVLLGLVPEA